MQKTWLHISDLHLGDDDMTSTRMRSKLLHFLRERPSGFDYVFLTGDIRTASKAENQFRPEMAKFLRNLCEAAGVSVERMFIVPGNHDVDRDAPGRAEAIQRVMYQRYGYYDARAGVIKPEDMEAVMEGERDFADFLSSFYPAVRAAMYANPKAPHFNVETEDFNILHVDSTVSYSKGQEANDLILGAKALYDVLGSLNPEKPTILLSHYPFMAFHQDEKRQLSAMLHDSGVRLWLAGHEHEQNLQPVKYLNSLQSGVLRYEKSMGPAFLIGEYDPLTFRCKASAYRWYDEGWAQYPFVNLDGEDKAVYEFQLEPQNKGRGSSLGKLARKANEPYFIRLTDKVENALFPRLKFAGAAYPLEEMLAESWKTAVDYVLLLADGGMGKSTMLLDSCRNSEIPSLYIPAERLVALRMGIEAYCAEVLFAGDIGKYRSSFRSRAPKPFLRVFIDGLNEVESTYERKFINEILSLGMLPGVQVVVATRSDFTSRYGGIQYHRAVLQPLEDEAIRRFFTNKEWAYIKDTGTLDRLLRNPMMVTVYREICSVIEDYKDVEFLDWALPVKNASDLFHNYYLAQIALMMRREADGRQILLAMSCIYDILPGIAYAYEKSYSLSKENSEFREILKEVLGQVKVRDWEALREYYREFGELNSDAGEVTDMLSNNLHLLYREGARMTDFPHQIYRDYLSAQWILRRSEELEHIEEIWNSRELPRPVIEHIKKSSGKYWSGSAHRIRFAGVGRTDAKMLIQNLLDCFPSDENVGVADYSGLDLSGVLLPDSLVLEDKISLDGATLDKHTLGLFSESPKLYTDMCFSHDGLFLAAASEKQVTIFSLAGNLPPFVHNMGRKAGSMLFNGDKLFVCAGNIMIYSFDGVWRYHGELNDPKGRLITAKLRSIILNGDIIHFYYTNREILYSLSDCKRTNIIHGKDRAENPVEGYDLTDLRHTERRNLPDGLSADAVAAAEGGGLLAVSYRDGRLEVTSGGEVMKVLSRGITMLADAAISGDGSRAVTLGMAASGGKRRVMVWDLEHGIKLGEVHCSELIYKIHLSENGRWMLGETRNDTWVYDFNNIAEKWYKGHFVSNQSGKLVMYGDDVIRKDGGLLLFNLETEEASPLDSPYESPRLVTFMNDGSVAAVSGSGGTLKFKSSRGSDFHTIYGDGASILSVHPFKNKPFVATADSRGLVNIYHTGTGQCLRHLETYHASNITIVHPTLTIIARSDGARFLETDNFYEYKVREQSRGRWYRNEYDDVCHKIDGNVLDMAFNERTESLEVILSNGKIMFFHEKYCRYKSEMQIITAFNAEAYDFRGVKCSEELKKILITNGIFDNSQ